MSHCERFSSLLPSPKRKVTDINTTLKAKSEEFTPNAINFDHIYSNDQFSLSFQDFVPLRQRNFDMKLPFPTEEEISQVYAKTKLHFDKLISKQNNNNKAINQNSGKNDENLKYITYKSTNPLNNNQEISSRIIKITEHVADPLQPHMYKINKSLPYLHEEISTPIHHKSDNPSNQITKEERDKWNIPAAISSWKNPNGYTIAIDKRVAMDSRYNKNSHKPYELNDGFLKLSDALDKAEQKARHEIQARAEAKKILAEQETLKKEEQLKLLAKQARDEREKTKYKRIKYDDTKEKVNRDTTKRELIRKERREQLEKDHKFSQMTTANKLRLLAYSQERDISEKVILGAVKGMENNEDLYDSRFFLKGAGSISTRENQIYDAPLFLQEETSDIHRPQNLNDYGKINNIISSGVKNNSISNPVQFTDPICEKTDLNNLKIEKSFSGATNQETNE